LVPEKSTPENAMTVIDEVSGALVAKFAVRVAFVNGAGAKARQISAVPSCTFVRCTSCHVRPAPVTLATVAGGSDAVLSPPTKASSSSLPRVVENAELVMLVLADATSDVTVVSIATVVAVATLEVKLTFVTFAPATVRFALAGL
jgi:hypothetical protein